MINISFEMFADVEGGLGEVLGEELVEVGVKLSEFFAGVAPIVLAISIGHLGIDVKPVLYGLGKVLLLVCLPVGVGQESFFFSFFIEALQSAVEGGVYLYDADAVDGVGELMDEDVLRMVFVYLVGQHILLCTTGERLFDGATESTCAEVPVECGVIDEIVVLWQVGGALIPSHDGHTCIALYHGLQDFWFEHACHSVKSAVCGHESGVGHSP